MARTAAPVSASCSPKADALLRPPHLCTHSHPADTLPAAKAWPAVQDDDIPGIVRYRTYEVLKEEVANPQLRWAYLPYSMHMAGPREAIQHMIIRKNYGAPSCLGLWTWPAQAGLT